MKQTIQINLGPLEQIPMGHGHSFLIKGEEIAVFRARSGKIFALDNRCPHRQGPLSEGIIGEGKVVCPLHGHKFDFMNGQGSDGHECVRVYNVGVEEGKIILEFDSTAPTSTFVKTLSI